MPFSDLYKSPKSPLSKLRHQPQQVPHLVSSDWDPELLSRDKERQKAAVKRYLDAKIRDDWDFQWTRPVEPSTQSVSEYAYDPDGEILTQDPKEKEDQNQNAVTPQGSSTQRQPPEDSSTLPLTTASKETAPDAGPSNDRVGCEGAQDQLSDLGLRELDDSEPRDAGYDADSGCESEYSVVSEDNLHFRSRTEWDSGQETEDDELSYATSPIRANAHLNYQFENPDSVGFDIQTRILQKRARIRRAMRHEMEWNDGLACFNARRDAWTGARTVRLKPTPPPISPPHDKTLSPLSPRRLFARDKSTPTSPVQASLGTVPLALHGTPSSGDSGEGEGVFSVRETTSKDTNTSSNSDENDNLLSRQRSGKKNKASKMYPVVTLLPNPPPLLPPENPMRASISPATYHSIFDKIVLQGMMPSCPVNLGDMVRACVSGWKRRGEFPPRISTPQYPRRQEPYLQQPFQFGHIRAMGPTVPVLEQPSVRYPIRKKVPPVQQPPPVPATPVSPVAPPPPPKSEARRKSFSFLTREKTKTAEKEKDQGKSKDKDGQDGDSKGEEGAAKAFRRSIQKVLGWHPHHARGASMDSSRSPPAGKSSAEARRSDESKIAVGDRKSDPAPALVSTELARGRSSGEAVKAIKETGISSTAAA